MRRRVCWTPTARGAFHVFSIMDRGHLGCQQMLNWAVVNSGPMTHGRQFRYILCVLLESQNVPSKVDTVFSQPVVDRVVLQTVWVCNEASGLPNCSLPNVALFHPLKSRDQRLGFGRYWSEKAD